MSSFKSYIINEGKITFDDFFDYLKDNVTSSSYQLNEYRDSNYSVIVTAYRNNDTICTINMGEEIEIYNEKPSGSFRPTSEQLLMIMDRLKNTFSRTEVLEHFSKMDESRYDESYKVYYKFAKKHNLKFKSMRDMSGVSNNAHSTSSDFGMGKDNVYDMSKLTSMNNRDTEKWLRSR
jgi:hypothetical protein